MNRPTRFVDTGYWLALVDRADTLHARAMQLARDIAGPFVTTEAVLTEVGNALAGRRWRSEAIALLQRLRLSPDVEIVPVTADLFDRAVDLYASRRDKEWGLTDCISFVAMGDRSIREALAADQHFVQAGFRAQLRES